MKKVILYIIGVAMAAITITGCTKNTLSEGAGTGKLVIENLGVQTDCTIDPLMSTFASKASVPSTKPLEVQICDMSNIEIVRYPSHLDMPLTTVLNAGEYMINVRSTPQFTGAALDTPLYAASQKVTIVAEQITTISVVCTQSTSSVTVKYSDMFRTAYPSEKYRYHSVLTSSEGAEITIPSDETRAAHFNIKSTNVIVTCQIFMEEKTASGTWNPIWGKTIPLKQVIFTVNKKTGVGTPEETTEGLKIAQNIDFTVTL
ncbi:MAG: DUF4493 domain-containing protein [Mucinivorans sp.]